MNSALFNRGIPWSADILRIIEKYPNLTDDLTIPIKDVESCIQEPHTASRFQGVTSAWRRKMERENNVIIKRTKLVDGTKVFLVLNNKGRVKIGNSGYKSGLKKVVVAGKRMQRTGQDGLSIDELRQRDHVAKMAATIACTASVEAKRIEYPDPIKKIGL